MKLLIPTRRLGWCFVFLVLFASTCIEGIRNKLKEHGDENEQALGITRIHEKRDHRGRVLQVACRQAVLKDSIVDQLRTQPLDLQGQPEDRRGVGRSALYPQSDLVIELQLMPDEEITTFKIKESTNHLGSYSGSRIHTNSSTPFGDVGEINLFANEYGHVAGSITRNGFIYQISTTESGEMLVTQIAMDALPPDSDPMVSQQQTRKLQSTNSSRKLQTTNTAGQGYYFNSSSYYYGDEPTYIDVLVPYTLRALCAISRATDRAENGTCAVTNEKMAVLSQQMELAILEANNALEKSGIPGRLRLAYTFMIDADFDETPLEYSEILFQAASSSDGVMEDISVMREKWGADVVALLVDNPSSCGLSYTGYPVEPQWAYSVVHWMCATGYYGLVHEIMHNLGAAHDRYTQKCPLKECCKPGCYNYGYQEPNGYFRTIMSFGCPSNRNCPRVQMFSQPRHPLVVGEGARQVSFPVGDQFNDNAQQIMNTWNTVANFKTFIPPRQIPGETDGYGYTYGYTDGGTVDGGTVDGGTVDGGTVDGGTVDEYEVPLDENGNPLNKCGDGYCNGAMGENCKTCPEDCVGGNFTYTVCGNGWCEEGEDCRSCRQDCAGRLQSDIPVDQRVCCVGGPPSLVSRNPLFHSCRSAMCKFNTECDVQKAQPPTPFCCGNQTCEPGEDVANCPYDCRCNNDGVCDAHEDESCRDCTPGAPRPQNRCMNAGRVCKGIFPDPCCESCNKHIGKCR